MQLIKLRSAIPLLQSRIVAAKTPQRHDRSLAAKTLPLSSSSMIAHSVSRSRGVPLPVTLPRHGC